MTTLSPPKVKAAPENSLEKKVYTIVNKFEDNIPTPNDRNRFAFSLVKYLNGEGDPPEILVKSTKIQIQGITSAELAASINEELTKLELI